jgi:hypothetical protein
METLSGNLHISVRDFSLTSEDKVNRNAQGAALDITSLDGISVKGAIENKGTLSLSASFDIKTGDISNAVGASMTIRSLADKEVWLGKVENLGNMDIFGRLRVDGLSSTGLGKLTLRGASMGSTGDVLMQSVFQNGAINPELGSVSITSSVYDITMDSGKEFRVLGNISGGKGQMLNVNANVVDVGGSIDAKGGTIIVSAADYMGNECRFGPGWCQISPTSTAKWELQEDIDEPNRWKLTGWDPWLGLKVGGSVSGGTQFHGVGRMDIGENFTFDDRSVLTFAVLPGETIDGYVYDSTIKEENNMLVLSPSKSEGFRPIISVGGNFVFDIKVQPDDKLKKVEKEKPEGGEFGLALFDLFESDEKRAEKVVWLIEAKKGIVVEGDYLPRNLSIYFCNADGTNCFNYEGYETYIRQHDENSIFAVFSDKYGGPIRVMKIQPEVRPLDPGFNIVSSAGALDNLAHYGLIKDKFNPTTAPIETLKAVFDDESIYGGMASALYDRMESFNSTRDQKMLSEFSRFFVPVEIGQFANMITVSEKLSSSSLQKRMVDESLWARNRVKGKAWSDVDLGMTAVTNPDSTEPMKGARMGVMGGYDIQINKQTIVGFNVGFSAQRSAEDAKFDLSIKQGVKDLRARNITANSTAFQLGAYFINRVAESTQAYMFANVYSHALDFERTQSFVNGVVTGAATSTSIGGEGGLIHQISGQYVVGNLFVRFAQNSGFTMTEKIGEVDYLSMEHDGYAIVAPGYSLTFQKRMYLKPTFIVRPYLSIGAEVEAVNTADPARYRFAPSDLYSEYEIDSAPLWGTAKFGLEFLSIGGLQFGAGYGYHYNAAVQAHNVNLSASMRF